MKLAGRVSDNPLPVPKRGKQRLFEGSKRVVKNRGWKKIKYTRPRHACANPRAPKEEPLRTIPEIMQASDAELYRILMQDGFISIPANAQCPKCKAGKLQPSESPMRLRCSAKKKCGKRTHILEGHPVFTFGSGVPSLQVQAACVLLVLSGVPATQVGRLMGVC